MIRLPNLDFLVSNLASEAKKKAALQRNSSSSDAITQAAGLVKTFQEIVESVFRLRPARHPRTFESAAVAGACIDSDKEGWFAQRRALRLNLEVELLKLDAFGSASYYDSAVWPSEEELWVLADLIDEAAQLIGKNSPMSRWGRCQKIDRDFPKLKSCARIKGFVARVAGEIPHRPYGVLMRMRCQNAKILRAKFFETVQSVQSKTVNHEDVRWLEFEPLLLFYQNDELKRHGLSERTDFWRKPNTPTGPKDALALITFLEMERADLLWRNRYQRHLWALLFWVQSLGDEQLLLLLAPFYAGSIDPIESWNVDSEEREKQRKREKAAARKAKSRRNLSEKCDQVGSVTLTDGSQPSRKV